MSSIEEIRAKIHNGIYTLVPKRKARSGVWETFSEIKTEKDVILDFVVCCIVCKNIQKYNGKQTTNLLRHKCYVDKYKIAAMDIDEIKRMQALEICTNWITEDGCSEDLIDGNGFKKMIQFFIRFGAKHGEYINLHHLLPHSSEILRNKNSKNDELTENYRTEDSSCSDIMIMNEPFVKIESDDESYNLPTSSSSDLNNSAKTNILSTTNSQFAVAKAFSTPIIFPNIPDIKRPKIETAKPIKSTKRKVLNDAIQDQKLKKSKTERFLELSCQTLEKIVKLSEDDSYDISGKKLAHELRLMNDHQRLLAEKIINEIVYSGRTNGLKETYVFRPY